MAGQAGSTMRDPEEVTIIVTSPGMSTTVMTDQEMDTVKTDRGMAIVTVGATVRTGRGTNVIAMTVQVIVADIVKVDQEMSAIVMTSQERITQGTTTCVIIAPGKTDPHETIGAPMTICKKTTITTAGSEMACIVMIFKMISHMKIGLEEEVVLVAEFHQGSMRSQKPL